MVWRHIDHIKLASAYTIVILAVDEHLQHVEDFVSFLRGCIAGGGGGGGGTIGGQCVGGQIIIRITIVAAPKLKEEQNKKITKM